MIAVQRQLFRTITIRYKKSLRSSKKVKIIVSNAGQRIVVDDTPQDPKICQNNWLGGDIIGLHYKVSMALHVHNTLR